MKNKKWFTLVELVLALMIAWTFVWIIMSLYTGIKWADMRMSNKRLLLWEATDLMNTIHDAALNYTIDYEEYFNRKQSNWSFTHYWNSWARYYCWSWMSLNTCQNTTWSNRYKYCKWNDANNWCAQNWNQKYWEYWFQHRKLVNPANLNDISNSWSNMRKWPVAISPNTWLTYLYLINPDWTERYYFRRIQSWTSDVNNDWQISWKNETLYKIQMLKLKWFDVWSWRDCNNRWAFDWFIDTRACDSSQWYKCKGQRIIGSCTDANGSWYRIPQTINDWRVDLTSDRVTVTDMKIDIYPNKDPYLVGNETWLVYDPYAKISFTMNLYGKSSNDEITMTTTLSFKNSYTRFAQIQYTWYIPDEAY